MWEGRNVEFWKTSLDGMDGISVWFAESFIFTEEDPDFVPDDAE